MCYVLNIRWEGRRSSYGRIFRTIFRTGCSRMRSAETSNCDISLRSIYTITIRVPLIRPNRRRSPNKLRLRLSIADSNYDLVLPERRCQRAALRVPDDVALDFWHGYTSIGKAGDDLKAVPFLRMPDDVKASRGRARSSEHLGVGTRKPFPDKWHHLPMAYYKQLMRERAEFAAARRMLDAIPIEFR